MKMPFGDLCDKYTIALLKQEYQPSDLHKHQVERYKAELDKIYHELNDVAQNRLTVYIDILHYANGLTWKAESDIRNAIDDDLPAEEYKWRTIRLKVSNALRIDYKNKISDLIGEPEFKEVKVDHASEEKQDE